MEHKIPPNTEILRQINSLLKDSKTIAIVCNQFGDTGKGKLVDYFASSWADIIARGTGGANAGHTICFGGQKHIFHLIPSGIIHDSEGKINIIGRGVAFDPAVIEHEISLLKQGGLSFDNLLFSKDAHLLLPQHILLDRAKEVKNGSIKLGTTGRGIGPLFEDHISRIGLSVNDLLNPEIFEKKLRRNLRDKIVFLKSFDQEKIKEIMQHEILGGGIYYDEENIFNVESIIKKYMEYGQLFKKHICDTDTFLREAVGTKNILLEGAQGNLLSIDDGTYPYVTSSDCTIAGLAKGVGLRESSVDMTFGIVKFPFMTRVGEGPFPTELGGEKSAIHCGASGVTKNTELEEFGTPELDDPDEFLQGIAIRMAGEEYGATTGRPRRTGWLDLPLLRYSIQFGSPHIILSKVDVMDNAKQIKICVAYEYIGPDYNFGNKVLKTGDILSIAPKDSNVLKYCKPKYATFPGWLEKTSEMKNFAELPVQLKKIISFVEKGVNAKVSIVSVGADREATIFTDP